MHFKTFTYAGKVEVVNSPTGSTALTATEPNAQVNHDVVAERRSSKSAGLEFINFEGVRAKPRKIVIRAAKSHII